MTHLVITYGYWALFGFVALESLGVPVPGETALVAAGIYAGSSHRLSPLMIVIVAALAGIIGDNIGFWIGAKGGDRFIRRFGRYIHVNEDRMRIGRYLFLRHGGTVVFFGRFISILRTYAAFLAGSSGMIRRRFLVFNAAGAVVWATLFGATAYFVGSAFTTISSTVSFILIGVALVGIAMGMVVAHRYEALLLPKADALLSGEATATLSRSDPRAENCF